MYATLEELCDEQDTQETEESLRRWYADNPERVAEMMIEGEWLIDNGDDRQVYIALATGEAIEAFRIFDTARSDYVEWAVNECMSTGLFPAGFEY